jgi:hypothetical protein
MKMLHELLRGNRQATKNASVHHQEKRRSDGRTRTERENDGRRSRNALATVSERRPATRRGERVQRRNTPEQRPLTSKMIPKTSIERHQDQTRSQIGGWRRRLDNVRRRLELQRRPTEKKNPRELGS